MNPVLKNQVAPVGLFARLAVPALCSLSSVHGVRWAVTSWKAVPLERLLIQVRLEYSYWLWVVILLRDWRLKVKGVEEVTDTVGSEAGGKARTMTGDKVCRVTSGIQQNSRNLCAVVSHFSVPTCPSQLLRTTSLVSSSFFSFSCPPHSFHQLIPLARSLKDTHNPMASPLNLCHLPPGLPQQCCSWSHDTLSILTIYSQHNSQAGPFKMQLKTKHPSAKVLG